jgi:hypothetical protein
MTSSTDSSLPENWRLLASLRPVYSSLIREFVVEVPACDVPEDSSSPSPEAADAVDAWFQEVDKQIQVHQLRQFLQTTTLANESVLRDLLVHHLQKSAKTPSDRDKIDFLLVQYFSLCAPSGLDDSDVDLDYLAQVFEPVFGPFQPKLPVWLNSLDNLMAAATRCQRLSELLHSGILDQGRRLKTQSGDRYYDPSAMVAFARFSFLMRRVFFRLMHADLNAIQDGLRELEHRGVRTIDCRRAQFSADEPVARLRMICQSWKVMFHAEYSSGQPLRMLVDLRASVDDALQGDISKTAPVARAAAVSAHSAAAGSASHAEFQVSSGSDGSEPPAHGRDE